jgi:hypothetical protein
MDHQGSVGDIAEKAARKEINANSYTQKRREAPTYAHVLSRKTVADPLTKEKERGKAKAKQSE